MNPSRILAYETGLPPWVPVIKIPGPDPEIRTQFLSIIGEPGPGIEPTPLPYQGRILPLNYIGWSFAADSNRALLLTKQVRRHLRLRSMERDEEIESSSQPWQGCILPLNQSRIGAFLRAATVKERYSKASIMLEKTGAGKRNRNGGRCPL